LDGLAWVYALCSASVLKEGNRPRSERTALAEQYAARAVGLLGRARQAGYFKVPANLAKLKADTDLDPLRLREDFKKILAELGNELKARSK
jgi:hypothetical protein